MGYTQKNNPFGKTSCGRRYGPLNLTNNNTSLQGSPAKLKNEPRKTTKGKNRNFQTTEEGAGMTPKGVASYRAKNPGSKLKTAVTGKVKAGSKAAKRRKSFCARSHSWTGERGKAARRRWRC